MRAFVGGLGLGALIGMLIAPAQGSQTRRRIRSRTTELRNRIRRAGHRATEQIRQSAGELRRATQRTGRRVPDGTAGETGAEAAAQRPSRPTRVQTPLSLLNNGSREELMAV